VAEEKQKQLEKTENEEKIKTLIHYFNAKKKLIDTVVALNKNNPKSNSESTKKEP